MEVGEQFAGYRIESLVGRGGMGVVYRAMQLDLGRAVALKLIAPEALEDEASRARFVSEARHAASIEHPHVVPIYAAGEANGTAYFVMRFVEGDDLRTRVRRDGPLASRHAAQILQSAAAALDAIHSAGLVHRDVKPANILLAAGDHVYLTDFGLARVALARESSTGSGRWAGSLHYAAPEQIRGGRVDARADVYALGGVLVFMLTGKVPFDRESDEATLWAHVADPPPRPSAMRHGLPKAFDDVAARAMAKLPDDRYASAGDLGRAALAAAQGRRAPRRHGAVAQGEASPSGARAVPGLRDEAPTLTASAALPGATRQRRRMLAGAIAAAAVLALGVGVLVARGGDAQQAAHAGAPRPAPASPSPTLSPSPSPALKGAHVAARFTHVGDRPIAVLRVGRDLWVTSVGLPLITRLDPLSGGRRAQGPNIGTGGVDLAAHGQTVWVANAYGRELLAVAAGSKRIIARIPQPGQPMAIAADTDGTIWAGLRLAEGGGPGAVTHYDVTGRSLGQIEVPSGVTAIALGAGAVWVAHARVPEILRIDPRSGTIRHAATLVAPAWSLAWGEGQLWASLPDNDLVARIDPVSARVTYADGGHRPEQLAVTGHRLFVASRADQTLRIIDPVHLTTTGRLPMPVNPYAVTADASHVWVAALGTDTVTRVDVR
jgi:DNA-binding beta-propeller fold protein YncE